MANKLVTWWKTPIPYKKTRGSIVIVCVLNAFASYLRVQNQQKLIQRIEALEVEVKGTPRNDELARALRNAMAKGRQSREG